MFLVVLMLMLIVRQNQRMKRSEFQKFLFVGFLDRRELETAIHLQYPDLTASLLEYIRDNLDEMEELMTKSSQEITAAMVTVSYEEQSQLAFRTYMDIRIQRAKEWDVQPRNPDMLTEEDEDEEEPVNRNYNEDFNASLHGFEDF